MATVNDSEISVHQLNHLLGQAKDIPQERIEEAQRRMLKTLVDQELLMAKAIADKLERSPEVLLALETARREVLSRAYLERIANSVAAPTDQEIRTYYDLNPNLFALRSIFEYRELLFPVESEDFAAVTDKIKASKSVDAAASQLTAMGEAVANLRKTATIIYTDSSLQPQSSPVVRSMQGASPGVLI